MSAAGAAQGHGPPRGGGPTRGGTAALGGGRRWGRGPLAEHHEPTAHETPCSPAAGPGPRPGLRARVPRRAATGSAWPARCSSSPWQVPTATSPDLGATARPSPDRVARRARPGSFGTAAVPAAAPDWPPTTSSPSLFVSAGDIADQHGQRRRAHGRAVGDEQGAVPRFNSREAPWPACRFRPRQREPAPCGPQPPRPRPHPQSTARGPTPGPSRRFSHRLRLLTAYSGAARPRTPRVSAGGQSRWRWSRRTSGHKCRESPSRRPPRPFRRNARGASARRCGHRRGG